ncbi:forkhead-associated domain-containing protein 1 [Limosa lapponica baueri]|uniref:Forkhead-associated domain-containing protein 1 n=1 Tax=Limosa lapponica baueri TaxID=1758121 RepID=A0A2I0T1L3_LIMLA|nr:forkhead-associated domain-containing protein 1 [Limosa lapponica baueri]
MGKKKAAVTKKGAEPLVVLMKDLPEGMVLKTGLEKETASVLGTELKASKAPGRVPNGGSYGAADGAASSEMEDVTDLGEKMVRER